MNACFNGISRLVNCYPARYVKIWYNTQRMENQHEVSSEETYIMQSGPVLSCHLDGRATSDRLLMMSFSLQPFQPFMN